MSEGDALHRTAAALRTALVGKVVRRFDAPGLTGPLPGAGRVIERVVCRHRNLDVTWDDGLVLHTSTGWYGAWHLYRDTERWRRGWDTLSVALEVSGFTAVCFRAAHVETYRAFDPVRHPAFGPQGPDVCSTRAHPNVIAASIAAVLGENITVSEALLDPRVVRGVGTVFRSEVLHEVGLHPAAPMTRLSVDDCQQLAVAALSAVRRSIVAGHLGVTMRVHGRNGRRCERCGDTVGAWSTPDGPVYFCPGCQTRNHPDDVTPTGLDRPIDPHPAAVQFLADLPWRRAQGDEHSATG